MAFQPQSNEQQDLIQKYTLKQASTTWQGNEDDHKRNWREEFVVIGFLHIVETFQQIIVEDLPTNRSIQWTLTLSGL